MDVYKAIKERLEPPDKFIWGFADLTGLVHERFKATPYALVIGVHLDDEIIDGIEEGPTKDYLALYLQTNALLDDTAFSIAEDLEKIGFDTTVIHASAPTELLGKDYTKTLRADFSHKLPATRAGLGWIGKTDLLVSFKWGPRVRFVTVLADKPLGEPGEPVTESQCGDCRLCVEKCPAKAANGKAWNTTVDRDEFYDPWKCRDYCKKATLERTRSEGTICGICVSVCPKGKQKR